MKNELRVIHLIPYYHHDYAWCNTRSWHRWRYLRAFEETLDRMKTDPDLTLTVDNILHSVGEFERFCPGRMGEFRALVEQGRICISNGGMALLRPGFYDGELYLRNAAAGMRGFCRLFGRTPEQIPTFWNADTAPGHSQMPQLLGQLGCRLYRFKRPEAALDGSGVPEVFRWKGLDGSCVLVERTSYSSPWEETFQQLDEDSWPEMRRRFVDEHLRQRFGRISTEEVIVPFGCDDGLPLRNYSDQPIAAGRLMAMWNAHEPSRMVYSTPDRFLRAVEKQPVPVWDGVLDPCELSFNAPFRADRSLWRARFEAERSILLYERLGALLAALGGPPPEPGGAGRLWRQSFEFCGHAMQFLLAEDYGPVLDGALGTIAQAKALCRAAGDAIACRAGAGTARRHVLINPASRPFAGLAELHITSERQVGGLRLTDTEGLPLPWQLTKVYQTMPGVPGTRPGQYSEVRVVCPVSVPANGYTSVFIGFDGGAMPEPFLPRSEKSFDIDTGKLRLHFENGLITGLQSGGRSLLAAAPALGLRFVSTRPTDSWYTDFESLSETEFRPADCVLRQGGPLRWEVETTGTIGSGTARLVTVLESGSGEVTFHLTLDNREKEGYYIADFPCDADPGLYAGIPFGEEARDTSAVLYTRRKSGQKMSFLDFERGWNGQLWANGYLRMKLGGADAAVLQGDCSIYYRNLPGSGRVSLLLMKSLDLEARTDRWVRELGGGASGAGIQHFTFGLCLPEGSPTLCLKEAVDRFRLPVLDVDRYCLEGGSAPQRFSLFEAENKGVFVTSVRQEEENSVVIRLYEAEGKGGPCALKCGFAVGRAVFTDLLDRPAGKPAAVSGRRISFELRPWEIATLRLWPAPAPAEGTP